MERNAAATYCRLADNMKHLHNPEAVKTFERLVDIERGYEREIEMWASDLDIEPAAPDETGIVPGADEELGEVEGEAAIDLMLTPWQALDMAVKDQQRAFEYFSDVASNAGDEDVRLQSEKIASRKLEHIALLRLERKRAWRTDERARIDVLVGQELPQSMESYQTSAQRVLGALRQRYLDLAQDADERDGAAEASLMREMAAGISGGTRPEELPAVNKGRAEERDLAAVVRAALRETEAAFDAYMIVAARAEQEDIMDAAQKDAAGCVTRMEHLRDCLSSHIETL